MNPLTNMKNVLKLSEQELRTGNKTSWHDQYRDSAWLFIGGLPYDLTEGDIICIFSQYGEIVNINLIRDKDSGKSKGFCFLCYEDQRSTDLAVDNFNGIKILNRIVRVDHVSSYKVPKQGKKTDAETKKLYDEGCAPKAVPILPINPANIKRDPDDLRETLADQIHSDIQLPRRLPINPVKREPKSDDEVNNKKEDKEIKHKKSKKKRKKKKKKRDSSSSSNSDSEDSESDFASKSKKKHKKKKSKEKSDVEDQTIDETTSTKFDPAFKHFHSQRENKYQDNRRDYDNKKDFRNFDNNREYRDKNERYRRSRSRSNDRGRRPDKPYYKERRDDRR